MEVTRLRSGVDIIEIDRMQSINPKIRERFIKRVFTAAEIGLCGENNASFAGRFAAKEAVAKALGTGIGEIRWQDIEILRGEQGEPILKLRNNAADIAASLGVKIWSLSISHNKTNAIAHVVGIG